MQFSKPEMQEILEKIGYEILVEKQDASNRRSRISRFSESQYVMLDGEKYTIEELFKIELKKRIFNL